MMTMVMILKTEPKYSQRKTFNLDDHDDNDDDDDDEKCDSNA